MATRTIPTVLDDRYEVGERLGRGGACEVWLARDRRLGRDVAVKVLHGEGVGDASRMATEAQLLASFNHPGLVQVFDAGQADGQPYVVLELVEGSSLADRVRRGPLDPAELAGVGGAVADALAYVHARGVVHRDVGPANVLCGSDGRTRLADFGIARLVDQARRTTASVALGTPTYMAPEQVRGGDVGAPADVYALGLVLTEAITGRAPFEGSGAEVALARLSRDPDVVTGVPAAWQPLLEEMTAADPAARPSATSVRDRLEALRSGAAGAMATAPVAVVASGADPGPDAPVDLEAVTIAQPTVGAEPPGDAIGGSTTVLPISAAPTPPGPRGRRPLLVVLGVVLLLLAVGLASSRDGGDVPSGLLTGPTSTTTASTEPAVEVPASVPTTAVTEAPAPAPEPKGKGKGREKAGKD